MPVKKILTWAIVIFVVYYLATQPQGAAHFVKGALSWVGDAGKSMTKFINNL